MPNEWASPPCILSLDVFSGVAHHRTLECPMNGSVKENVAESCKRELKQWLKQVHLVVSGVVGVVSTLCLSSLQYIITVSQANNGVLLFFLLLLRLFIRVTEIARREGCTRAEVPQRNGGHRAHGVAGDPSRQQRRPVLGRFVPQDVTARQTRTGAIARELMFRIIRFFIIFER